MLGSPFVYVFISLTQFALRLGLEACCILHALSFKSCLYSGRLDKVLHTGSDCCALGAALLNSKIQFKSPCHVWNYDTFVDGMEDRYASCWIC